MLPNTSMTFSTPCAFMAKPPLVPLLRHHHRHHLTNPPRIRRRPPHYGALYQFTTSSSEFDKDYSKFQDNDADANARSQFGTKSYWDAMYEGMGDFDANEYSWYYGFEVVKPYLLDYTAADDDADNKQDKSTISILIPGCGNDPLLLDMYNAGYQRLTAFDYSEGAIERQNSLLEYLPMGSNLDSVALTVEDARALPKEWEQSFDVIIEKGALDAIYLSGDGNFEESVKEFLRCLKVGGVCMSFSGVVPEDVRREGFDEDNWEWLRDGSDDLKAGCFVLRKI